MKKIALDLDGVVFDSENLYRVYSEIYDVNVLNRDSIINNSFRTIQERYDWNEKIFNDFMSKYNKEIIEKSNLMPGIEVVLKLLSKYYEFIIITARNDYEIKISKNVLEKIGLGNIKLINNDLKKIDSLLKEECDYIIDDNEIVCEEAYYNGVKSIYFKNPASNIILNEEIKTVNNWGEIYKYLMYERLIKE